jgi:tRNA A-37 threonylcarbamoyl transferase component Bud32
VSESDLAGACPDEPCATAPAPGASPRERALRPGTTFAGRYVLTGLLGAGGMAEVYAARDEVLDREVAIKVFHPSRAGRASDERHRAEMRLLARLSHPGLVTVFDAGTTSLPDAPQQDFLVMELVRGPSLAARLASGPLPADAAAVVGAHVAEALAYIHDESVVHRDVKPANILLPPEERSGTTAPWTKLADFGIARVRTDDHLTATGELLGTPSYLSPEQATGSPLTPASDVYALGLVLVEALTGERAFPGSALESAVARLHRPAPVPTHLGPRWAALLTAMTALDAVDRPTAAAAAEELRLLLRPGASATGPVVGDVGAVPVTERLEPVVLATTGVAAAGLPTADLPAHDAVVDDVVVDRTPTAAGGERRRPRRRRAARVTAVAAVAGVAVALLGARVLGAEDPVAGPAPTATPSTAPVAGAVTAAVVAGAFTSPGSAQGADPVQEADQGRPSDVASTVGVVADGSGPAAPAAAGGDAEPVGTSGPSGKAGPAAHADDRAHANARDRAERAGGKG